MIVRQMGLRLYWEGCLKEGVDLTCDLEDLRV